MLLGFCFGRKGFSTSLAFEGFGQDMLFFDMPFADAFGAHVLATENTVVEHCTRFTVHLVSRWEARLGSSLFLIVMHITGTARSSLRIDCQ